MKLVIELPGEPRGKERPRFSSGYTKTGKFFKHVYTPARTRSYEQALAWAGKAAMRGRSLLDGPLRVSIRAFFSVPIRWAREERMAALAGEIYPDKIDLDNIGKIACDSLNGIVWIDDGQIVEISISKTYAAVGMLRTEVECLSGQLAGQRPKKKRQRRVILAGADSMLFAGKSSR